MKKLLYFFSVSLILTTVNACKNLDNNPAPSQTLSGSVTDKTSGKPIQTEVGSGGIRIKLEELSWSDSPTPFYFYTMQDGTFNNTKLFGGENRVSVEGAFVPLVQYDTQGKIKVDDSQTLEIGKVAKVDFKVEPLLNVEWVGDPVYSDDGTITANVKFTRGTTNAEFQKNITDVFLFVNPTTYLGNNNYDNRYSTQISYSGTQGNDLTGQTVTIKTKGGTLPGKRNYYVRVGARTDYGLKQYNYNEPKMVAVP